MGDVVQYGTSAITQKHSQIVHGYGNYEGTPTLLMAQHSGGDLNIPLHKYIKMTNYTYVTHYDL
jgi:hypothetical protein